MIFDTKIDVSCFEDLEDQLITCPNETFADLCYSDAVDTDPANDPDWCIFVNTPRRLNWDRNDNAVREPDSDEFGFLVCFHLSLYFRSMWTNGFIAPSAEHRPICQTG